MIVDATDEDERGEAFGFYGAFQVGGFAVGPVIGAFGIAFFGGYAFPFFFTGLLAVMGALVIVRFVPRYPKTEHPDRVEAAGRSRASRLPRPRCGPSSTGRSSRRSCSRSASTCRSGPTRSSGRST